MGTDQIAAFNGWLTRKVVENPRKIVKITRKVVENLEPTAEMAHVEKLVSYFKYYVFQAFRVFLKAFLSAVVFLARNVHIFLRSAPYS